MISRSLGSAVLAACLLACGCHQANTPVAPNSPASGPDAARAANQEFLNRKAYDPWILKSTPGSSAIPLYWSDGRTGELIDQDGSIKQKLTAGLYQHDQLVPQPHGAMAGIASAAGPMQLQTLDLRTGMLTQQNNGVTGSGSARSDYWKRVWDTSDLVVDGDPEAQQVAHAQLFYLLSSTYPGSANSIPPMGLSSTTYQGHIFWDADVWMFPVFVVQHPDEARSIVDYRFHRLGQAIKNAQAHHFPGAEFPWESASTGAEVAPAEFARERHITADVAFAAWQYYLWTGDLTYLKTEGWPILKATAAYWTGRATKDADGSYHIRGVVPPDETAGQVDDDSYTNAAARYNLAAATAAAKLVGAAPDPQWETVARKIVIPNDGQRGIPAEHAGPQTDRMQAKQADALLMIWPLGVQFDPATEGKMLDFYSQHTIKTGPAMTAGIHAVVAARLGRGADALNFYRDSYRPFMRGGWDAFSEKRTTNNVYFLTGMAASLQSIYYGFAGLQVRANGESGPGARVAGDSVASLYADPHLPPGWTGLTIEGIRFRGKQFDLKIDQGGHVIVVKLPK